MENLEYLLERIFIASNMPVRAIYLADGCQTATYGYQPAADPFSASEIRRPVLLTAERLGKPFISIEADFCAYGALRGSDAVLIVVGPVMLRQLSNHEAEEFAFKHQISPRDVMLNTASLAQIAAILSLVNYALAGEQLPEEAISIDNAYKPQASTLNESDVKSYILQNVENNVTHVTVQNEVLYLQLIREGNVESIISRGTQSINLNSIGILAKNPFKHYEYMICTSIALATRAAIEGGLDQQTAYSMSDLYLQRLELCNTIDDIIKVQQDMTLAFARQVRKSKESRSAKSYVEKCKIIIANNLSKPIELEEIAEKVGVNKAYLARKFKSETGMGVMQYLRSKRIEAATRMLKYSDEPIASIASYFCFSSQSHFGLVFREIMQMSPQKYRDNESVL